MITPCLKDKDILITQRTLQSMRRQSLLAQAHLAKRQNVFDFNNTRPWPVKKSSVAHRLRNPALNDVRCAAIVERVVPPRCLTRASLQSYSGWTQSNTISRYCFHRRCFCRCMP